jgi:2-phospho-L-lactate guanylyltransferase
MSQPKQLWVTIPAKPLDEGKSRLASALTGQERHGLARRLLERTLGVVLSMPGLAGVLVVSRDLEILALAEGYGALALAEKGNGMESLGEKEWGLNQAVAQAADFALRERGDALLFLPTDLPLLQADDIHRLVWAWDGRENCVVIAPSHDGGTNALLLSPPDAIAPAFGVDSFARHVRLAEAKGLSVAVVESEGLAWDVDTPEEYRLMAGTENGTLIYADKR